MIRLIELLSDHKALSAPSTNAISTILGDPYLYHHNRVFKNIRDVALHLGYVFTDKDSELWRLYQAFSLISLGWLIEAKEIPFLDNVSGLVRVAVTKPDLKILPALLLTALKRNFLMHEASHGIAASILANTPDPLLNSLSEGEATVIRALMSEAFANSTEKLSSSEVATPAHGLYFALNSYIPYQTSEITQLRELINTVGRHAIFVFSFYLYFFSNIFSRQLTADELEYISTQGCFGLLSSEDSGTEIFNGLLAVRCFVNPRFRHETNVMYFDLVSCSEAFESLVDSSFLLDKSLLTTLRSYAEVFWNIVEHGIQGIEHPVDVYAHTSSTI